MARRILPLLLALAAASAHAQAPRKKVALALSGGGAYGLIYLGALEWMERHRIPVDAIAGTSGGALVGGWYATGLELLSDDEILHPQEPKDKNDLKLRGVAETLSKIDYERLFDSQPDYRNLSMLQKRERRLYPSDFFGGLASDRTLRRDGLVPGQTVGFLLDYVGRDYPLSFEELPTPFRAVAVDAAEEDPEKWRTVVLGGPSPEIPLGLSRAIRASIAVPILFAPVVEGPHRLIDGAVRDNLPTDVAIDAFDPDVLIALRFDAGYGPDPYRPGRRDVREKLLVTFNPGKNRVDQFARWRDLAWLGYQGMEARRAELERYALSPEDYLAYRRGRKAKTFDHVPQKVEGDVGGLDEVRRAVVGRNLDDLAVTKALGQALDRLVAGQGLATAGYDLRPGGVLYVRTTRHRGGPAFLRAGLDVDANSADRPWLGARVRVSDLRAGRTAYWTDLVAGNTPSLSGGADLPLGGNFSLTPTAHLGREIQFRFDGRDRASEAAISTAEARLALAYRPTRSVEFTLGGLFGTNGASGRYGAPLKTDTGSYRSLLARAELDTTDDAVVPRQGARLALEASLGRIGGSLDTYVGPARDAWGLHAAFGLGDDLPFPFQFRPRLDAYRRDEIRADRFLSLGLSETHALSPLPFAFGRLFLVGRLESAWTPRRAYPGASLGLLADTRGGTGYLGLGVAEHGAVRLILQLGRRF